MTITWHFKNPVEISYFTELVHGTSIKMITNKFWYDLFQTKDIFVSNVGKTYLASFILNVIFVDIAKFASWFETCLETPRSKINATTWDNYAEDE